jgi:hypothetical protein
MRHVEFTRVMQPYQPGDRRVLPDELAAKLLKEDSAKDLGAFPPPDVAPEKPATESRTRRYFTRKRA